MEALHQAPALVNLLYEYFHTIQMEAGWSCVKWLSGGSAGYVAIPLAAGRGEISLTQQTRSYLNSTRNSSSSLRALETSARASNDPYAVGFVASDYLARTYGSDLVKQHNVGEPKGGERLEEGVRDDLRYFGRSVLRRV